MKIEDINKEDAFLFVGGLGVIVILYILFKPEKDEQTVSVTATISDQHGNTIAYNPTDKVKELRKVLTTTYYLDFSERWAAITKLERLENFKFMAVVKAYEAAYGVTLEADMRACTMTSPNFFKIYDRIQTLDGLIV